MKNFILDLEIKSTIKFRQRRYIYMEESAQKVEEQVVLDGKNVSKKELEEEKSKFDRKIVENGDGSFKTLTRLRD